MVSKKGSRSTSRTIKYKSKPDSFSESAANKTLEWVHIVPRRGVTYVGKQGRSTERLGSGKHLATGKRYWRTGYRRKDGTRVKGHYVKYGWAVKTVSGRPTSKLFTSKERAIAYAVKMSKASGGEIVIHGRDGRIREKVSYDPLPPKKS
jgi:hypothetical protein